jgi:serine/threonine protein kinase
MGVVFLAEEREPVRRHVALKLLKWRPNSRETAARLEAERQALASLCHPGVAQLYEAGTTDEGHPYFAMEYVEGGPITRRCDELRLPIDRRLRLFQAVCEAVEHAHGRGIVHRDLKPSNILLGGDAERPFVKVDAPGWPTGCRSSHAATRPPRRPPPPPSSPSRRPR